MSGWNLWLREQITFHWETQLRPRLAGMTDAEYFWEPVPGCWNVRPVGVGDAQIHAGTGSMRIDFAFPQPEPAPVTTIAWRLGHVIVGVLAMRNASHFGGPAAEYGTWEYAATADAALAQLDAAYAAWIAGVEQWGEAGLLTPVGDKEPGWESSPNAVLVLHIHRELIHHLAEVSLLRDLYLHTPKG